MVFSMKLLSSNGLTNLVQSCTSKLNDTLEQKRHAIGITLAAHSRYNFRTALDDNSVGQLRHFLKWTALTHLRCL